ncbi:MAG: UDP-glucose/GDP-mannose dehydrogenase family protein [Proteobacteria bacterium]|jgi:UDPglucose 6-dehydrogenase|nr:UDP-glucose/GDP-mannose dehydrogenase family protein [Pseudomonadota bacterium]
MNIGVIGTGYVGLVTGTCFADVGNQVICVDNNKDKVADLNRGKLPIYEPGLASLVAENEAAGRLIFTTDIARAVQECEVLFIAVGTPPDEDGSADLRHVLGVASEIGEHVNDYRVIVTKSTVPVGTAEKVSAAIARKLKGRSADVQYAVASNPEFLKEGAAIDDFMKPDRIIVGVEDDRAIELMRELYAPFNRNRERLVFMDIPSAELTKYAANAMLATKISFMNELSNIADKLGADIELVRHGIGSDPRIGYQFIYPGCGYGGSCFPKDVQALFRTAGDVGYNARILRAVEDVNADQKYLLLNKIDAAYADREDGIGGIKGKTFALWGLSFKPGTDDMREAPSRVIIEGLWERGASVRAYDPVAMEEAGRIYGERDDLSLANTENDALQGADALVIVTEWKSFRSPDFALMSEALSDKLVFDGRNLYEPATVAAHGLQYHSIGRRSS